MLICIDDVKNIIFAKLAVSTTTASTLPACLVSMPPSKLWREPNPALRIRIYYQLPTPTFAFLVVWLQPNVGQMGIWDVEDRGR